MGVLIAIAAAVVAYICVLLAVILTPILILLCLWTGLCIFAAVFMFLFWLLVTHQTHTLYSAVFMATWGFPPMLLASLVGYYGEQIRARRKAPLLTLHGDAPFR
jgi:hypothetical protein